MLGNAKNSLIDGISIHNSYSRSVGLHSSHNLLI